MSRGELETRVEERTSELSRVNARFETALHGAKVHVFSQDRDLKYTWMYGSLDEAANAEDASAAPITNCCVRRNVTRWSR